LVVVALDVDDVLRVEHLDAEDDVDAFSTSVDLELLLELDDASR
jgi:hypothetical protein